MTPITFSYDGWFAQLLIFGNLHDVRGNLAIDRHCLSAWQFDTCGIVAAIIKAIIFGVLIGAVMSLLVAAVCAAVGIAGFSLWSFVMALYAHGFDWRQWDSTATVFASLTGTSLVLVTAYHALVKAMQGWKRLHVANALHEAATGRVCAPVRFTKP